MDKTKKTATIVESQNKKVKAQDSQAAERNRELEGQLKRALADYQNLERRIEEERRLLSQLSSVILIEKFLPVLDNLENAESHLKDEGLEMVIRQFKDILSQEGLEEVKSEGEKFDPNLHEAVDVVSGEKDNLIVKVHNKGYKINNKVIRPAKVTVERKAVEKQAEEKADELGDFA